ncbi:efflux RND transporter periplasmic adaptor subunit [Limimaricola cinnabarinus]|uniref:efflux RND transporter periplasmic adaptor subunit n=1 Tax=Limimaricola cinnabarinus TaxID=1125964 RepID=UPI002490B807|nr:efflux RND transporter periplasmic adaptor subunit [Limimaricola cinnabarinus]
MRSATDAARLPGEITRGVVADDAVVEAGDVLFELGPRPLELVPAQAEANLTPTAQNISASSASLVAAQAQLERAQYDLASTIMRAPHLGVVTNVTLSEGQYIGAGNPALTFIDSGAAWITVDLRENPLQQVDPGDPAHLLFDALPGRIFEGRVESIAWGINPGRNVQSGLVVNQPANRRFEPAWQIPVRIEPAGGMENLSDAVRVGGKVHAVDYGSGTGNPIAQAAAMYVTPRSVLSEDPLYAVRLALTFATIPILNPALPPIIAALPVGLIVAQRGTFNPVRMLAAPVVMILLVHVMTWCVEQLRPMPVVYVGAMWLTCFFGFRMVLQTGAMAAC